MNPNSFNGLEALTTRQEYVILLTNQYNQVLVTKSPSSFERPQPADWQLPTGRVPTGQSYELAAINRVKSQFGFFFDPCLLDTVQRVTPSGISEVTYFEGRTTLPMEAADNQPDILWMGVDMLDNYNLELSHKQAIYDYLMPADFNDHN